MAKLGNIGEHVSAAHVSGNMFPRFIAGLYNTLNLTLNFKSTQALIFCLVKGYKST